MIVLTGAAGFIGSNMLKYLNQNGITEIIAVDSIYEAENWKLLRGTVFYDYIDKEDLFTYLDKESVSIELIIHLGACSNTTEKNFNFLLENNYEYSKKLFEYSNKNNIPFLYASSAATYGNGEEGFSDSTDPRNLLPLNRYGYLKNLFDQYVLNSQHKNKVVGFKFFNVYGPGEEYKGNMASVIFKKYNEIKSGCQPTLFKSHLADIADGEQLRDFIYIDDVCKVIYYFMTNTDYSGIINVGTGKAKTFNKAINSLLNSLGVSSSISYIDFPTELEKQYQSFTQADIRELRTQNYVEDFINLEEGIEKYVRYLEEEE
ncbi:TPA: ADP-glyceromanno-heptose 6-epimerase [Streptococcus suis]